MVSYGACLSSGTTGFFTDAEPSCWTFVGEFQTKFGCEYVGADYAVGSVKIISVAALLNAD